MTYDVSEQVEISFSIVQEVGRLAEMSIQGSVKPDSANLLEDVWDWECILLGLKHFWIIGDSNVRVLK